MPAAKSPTELVLREPLNLDRYYQRNVVGISAVEFLWGLGLPVVIESTFLQLFLKSMGASNLTVGLIPFFFFMGISVFALLSSYITEHMVLKKAPVILLHLFSGVMMLAIGAGLLLLGKSPAFLSIFFGCYAVFSILIGMTLPIWYNFLVKIFTEERTVSGLAFMLIAQNIAKLMGSVFIVHFVDRYAFSTHHSALIFMLVGLFFSIGALFFLMTKELPQHREEQLKQDQSFLNYVHSAMSSVWKNKNFLIFLGGDADLYVIITVISFYAHYATAYCDIAPALAAGAFVALIYFGATFASIVLGPMGWFSIKGKYLFEKLAALMAMGILVLINSIWGFLLASFLLGVARGTRMLVYAPAVKKLSGLSDATRYFAVAPIFTLPFSALLPLICGKFLDRFQGLGEFAYQIVFGIAFLLIITSGYYILKTNFSPLKN